VSFSTQLGGESVYGIIKS